MFIKHGVPPKEESAQIMKKHIDKEIEALRGGAPAEGHLYFSADEVHLFDNFILDDSRVIFDFDKGNNWMELSGSGKLSNNGVIESGTLTDFRLSGDLKITTGSDMLLIENTIIDPDSNIEIVVQDGTRVVLNSLSIGEGASLTLIGDLDSAMITGSVFESGSRLNISGDYEAAIVGCVFKDAATSNIWVDLPKELRDSNVLIEEHPTEEKEFEAPTEGWGLPLLSLALAGIMGVAKSKSKKKRVKVQKVKKEQPVYEEVR